MGAVASTEPQTAQPLPRTDLWAVGVTRVLVAICAWLLIALHVIRPNFQIQGLKSIFFLSVGMIILAARIRGVKTFARTPIDTAFVLWLGLAVVSQLYATLALNRLLMMDDMQKYLVIIITTWAVYRAAFALTVVDPRTSSGAFIKAILFFLGFACVIGILQGFGPGSLRSAAIDFANNFGVKGDATELSLELSSPRPIALFSGPNYFGFMNLIGMAIIIGLTVVQGTAMSAKSVWFSTVGLFIFLVGTIAAQSRFAILTCFLLLLFFLIFMLRTGRRKVFVSGVLAIGVMAIGGLVMTYALDLRYLQDSFDKRITDDSSYRLRQAALEEVVDRAGDLAPLGAGWDSLGYTLHRTGDVWARTNATDNGYLQAFVNHGVPGVLHLAFLFGACFYAIKLAKPFPQAHIRALRVIALLLVITYMAYSLSGVRHAKLETSVYWMIVFGCLYGAVYGERFFGPPFELRRVAPGAAPVGS